MLGHAHVLSTCDIRLAFSFYPHSPLQKQGRNSKRQFTDERLRCGQGKWPKGKLGAPLGLQPEFLTPRLSLRPSASGPGAGPGGLERSDMVGWEASGPRVRRSSPCPALPSVSHTDQGARGEGTLWLRGFMAETTVCSLSCAGLSHPGSGFTHPCSPQMGFPAGAQGPSAWSGPGMAPFPICAGALWVRLLL